MVRYTAWLLVHLVHRNGTRSPHRCRRHLQPCRVRLPRLSLPLTLRSLSLARIPEPPRENSLSVTQEGRPHSRGLISAARPTGSHNLATCHLPVLSRMLRIRTSTSKASTSSCAVS